MHKCYSYACNNIMATPKPNFSLYTAVTVNIEPLLSSFPFILVRQTQVLWYLDECLKINTMYA